MAGSHGLLHPLQPAVVEHDVERGLRVPHDQPRRQLPAPLGAVVLGYGRRAQAGAENIHDKVVGDARDRDEVGDEVHGRERVQGARAHAERGEHEVPGPVPVEGEPDQKSRQRHFRQTPAPAAADDGFGVDPDLVGHGRAVSPVPDRVRPRLLQQAAVVDSGLRLAADRLALERGGVAGAGEPEQARREYENGERAQAGVVSPARDVAGERRLAGPCGECGLPGLVFVHHGVLSLSGRQRGWEFSFGRGRASSSALTRTPAKWGCGKCFGICFCSYA